MRPDIHAHRRIKLQRRPPVLCFGIPKHDPIFFANLVVEIRQVRDSKRSGPACAAPATSAAPAIPSADRPFPFDSASVPRGTESTTTMSTPPERISASAISSACSRCLAATPANCHIHAELPRVNRIQCVLCVDDAACRRLCASASRAASWSSCRPIRPVNFNHASRGIRPRPAPHHIERQPWNYTDGHQYIAAAQCA